jgi:hypothetical protein
VAFQHAASLPGLHAGDTTEYVPKTINWRVVLKSWLGEGRGKPYDIPPPQAIVETLTGRWGDEGQKKYDRQRRIENRR